MLAGRTLRARRGVGIRMLASNAATVLSSSAVRTTLLITFHGMLPRTSRRSAARVELEDGYL